MEGHHQACVAECWRAFVLLQSERLGTCVAWFEVGGTCRLMLRPPTGNSSVSRSDEICICNKAKAPKILFGPSGEVQYARRYFARKLLYLTCFLGPGTAGGIFRGDRGGARAGV